MANNTRIIYDEVNQKVILNGKPYTKDSIKNIALALLVLGTLLICFSFLIMPVGIFFIIIGLYVVFQGILYYLCSKTLENKITLLQETKVFKPEISEPEAAEPKTPIKPSESDTICNPLKTEIHNVAGTSYHQNEISFLAVENDDFSLSKSDLIDFFMTDEKIYQYAFHPVSIKLVEEPDNEYDSNAIKVVIDDVHVGYIKKDECLHVKELIKKDKIQRITADIHGGKYKILVSDYDIEKNKDVYKFERDKTDYFIVLSIELK